MRNLRRFWVTGATNGLGLALVQGLLEQGCHVATSGKPCRELDDLEAHHPGQLLRLPAPLHDAAQAHLAAARLQAEWGTLDGLIVNAGSCDYLPQAQASDELFEAIVTSNLLASEHCLAGALPLLVKGDAPQVMAIFSPCTTLQLHDPAQPPSGVNNLPQWFREQRQTLHALGIDLAMVAPQSLTTPVTPARAIPEQWTPYRAAQALLQRLPQREPELVLEALSLNSLWPLPH
ncbi:MULTISPECIES: SDR family NAD(P)-dependent oxidoreductase [Pseudomonas]|uniref:SDR family NAD(P)-dependent oxidoreductase n=1 Tax=Pseudomonas TaxID=286 RepID=UPI001CE4556E|nr:MULTISPECIES: SDR family NAD(P)-dependent oxidoreductase [Pseudomonas]MCO7592777.1 SDR family oxidoreductase [Pseudomonas guariconensis]MCO7630950.1 SDR family oxidoreductase [Pseudomonas guariconensis]MCU7219971.1 SDR family oxidoreductase [Pseudomonas brassicacearum]